MTMLTLRGGGRYPLWFEDILGYTSIATADVDPIATYQAGAKTTATLSVLNTYLANGFGIKNATENAGYIYAITWSQFDAYVKSHRSTVPADYDLSAIVPRQIQLMGGEWCLTPLVKVFADDDGTYASTVTTVNIGRIL